MLTIVKSGLLTQWTDSGRVNSQVNGYSQSGAIDWFNFKLANAMCGKPLTSPVLEVLGGNLKFKVDDMCLMSITGGHAQLTINDGLAIDTAQSKKGKIYLVKPGDVISLGPINNGVFTYIGFSAQVNLPTFGNSVCAVKREMIGGWREDGQGLKDGDKFSFKVCHNIDKSVSRFFTNGQYHLSLAPAIQKLLSLQMSHIKTIPFSFCYQANIFNNIEKQRFLAHKYEVSSYIDKMGIRLSGPTINSVSERLTSQPMANGSIQIPGNGMPIIMRNERQTIGGYPVIGTVSSEGLAILSQAAVNQTIYFTPTDFKTSTIWRQLIEIVLKQVLNKTTLMLKA
jgi:biotin-dependent carboxylase-like uncharacterized protein